jgi:hypothetical protein
MKERSRYVFGAALVGAALAGIPNLIDVHQAQGATVGLFTFEAFTSAGSTTGTSFGTYAADSGVGTALGVHASTGAVWSNPAGNGSARSLSSNGWALGDYYEFDVPTSTFSNIIAEFDTTASGTGPKTFNFLYSTDGTNFSSFGSYTVLTTPAWSSTSTAFNTAFHILFDLSAVTGLNNNANAKFRVVDTDTTATAAAGTNRIDNFLVSGAIPEPATAAVTLMSAAAAMLLRPRRKD